MDTHNQARAILSQLVGKEVEPGIQAWQAAFRTVQQQPPEGHRPQLHAGGQGNDTATCSCGWGSKPFDGLVLAADEWLLHAGEHIECPDSITT